MRQPCSKNLVMPRLALALVARIFSATGAYAQDPSHPLVLAAYVDAAGGADLTAGK